MRRPLLAAIALVVAGAAACASEGVVGSFSPDDAGAGADAADGDAGASGDGAPIARSTIAIGAGGASTCVRTADAHARCWGENASGSLGIGDVEPSSSTTPVTPQNVDRVAAIASGEYAQCAIRADGKILCWGDMFIGDFNGQSFDHLPVPTSFVQDGYGDVARAAVGRYYLCAITTAGELSCSGLNDEGQLGTGTTEKKYLPTRVGELDGAATSVAASMGGVTTCATTQPGSVYCWGRNDHGQAGPVGEPILAPRKIEGLPPRAVEVVVGGAHACARFATGDVRCWGANDEGQLGDGTRSLHADVVTPKYVADAVALAAGKAHTCALHRNGSVLCWGANDVGQVGDTPDATVPIVVWPESFGARAVTCGDAHTCAWNEAGRVHCWGSNARGQLGAGDATF